MASKKAGWIPLKAGSVVDVVAPGFRPTDAEAESGIRFLESWGLKPRVPKDLFGKDVLSSNSDQARARQLIKALESPSSDAVWCLRGGYGSIRLVPFLMKMKKPKRMKPILGLSDITTLQQFVLKRWGWSSLQTPLLDRLGRIVSPELAMSESGKMRPLPIAEEVTELRSILFGEKTTIRHEGLKPLGKTRGGGASKTLVKGVMAGGNLLTYASANGTAIHPDTSGQILYFEDVGERGYRVDRWLVQMAQAGILSRKTKAIVFGEFMEGNEPQGGSLVGDVLARFTKEWADVNKVPVYSGILSGHGQHQRVVPIGTQATLDPKTGVLEIETGVGLGGGRRISPTMGPIK